MRGRCVTRSPRSPALEQQAVLLFYMGGCSHAEVATFLGVTSNAVKTRLYAARQHLRRHMDDIETRLEGRAAVERRERSRTGSHA